MGSKGSNTTTQNTQQTQTYAPAGAGYITNALNRAGETANLPFAIPQAPVAGFSPQQLQAFGQVGELQGMAQPYYNKAASYFSPEGAQQFYNPYASNVMAGLKDIFGAQNTQTTGNLTQAAGGVGADRIAVGQSELARQQGLSAGQTLANIYGQAGQMAQAAGQGQMALGNQAQTSALQGTQALLGTGGLQQQLQQAQMNAPYQQQLAMAAFPYQQAQFLAGITGALAPGLGGTTSGTGTTTRTSPGPSLFSQLLGGGMLGLGAYNAFAPEGGGGMGPETAGQAGSPYEGPVRSADGGAVRENPYAISYDDGGGVERTGHIIPNSDPIDVSKMTLVPQSQLTPIQAQVPQLNLNPQMPEEKQQSGPDLASIAKMAMAFAARGGAIHPYASGGRLPHFAFGGDADDNDPTPATFDERFPYRVAGPEAMDKWRTGVDRDTAAGVTEQASNGLPSIITQGTGTPQTSALAFAPDNATVAAITPPDNPIPGPKVSPGTRQTVAELGGEGAGALGGQGVSPYSQGLEMAPVAYSPPTRSKADRSPWLALMAAGAGMMSGTSPYAGVNIGQGAAAGINTLNTIRQANQRDETLDQSARRLAQEAASHKDNFNIQKEQLAISKLNAEKEKWSPAGSVYTPDGKVQPLVMNTGTGEIRNAVTGKPPTENDKIVPKTGGKTSGPVDQGEARAVAEYFVRTGDMARINALGVTSEARQAVQSQVRHVQKELGVSDEELATKRVEFEGRKAGQRTLGVMEARMGSAAIEAEGAIKQARGVIEKLPRTSFLPWNELLQLKDKKLLNPDQAELYARTQAIVNTYSAVMARGANITTDNSRHHAAELLNTAGDPATFNRVLDTMLQEIAMAKDSPLKMREFYRNMYNRDPGDASKEKPKTETSKKELAPADQQALDWANANPKDPRSAEIKKKLGAQ